MICKEVQRKIYRNEMGACYGRNNWILVNPRCHEYHASSSSFGGCDVTTDGSRLRARLFDSDVTGFSVCSNFWEDSGLRALASRSRFSRTRCRSSFKSSGTVDSIACSFCSFVAASLNLVFNTLHLFLTAARGH